MDWTSLSTALGGLGLLLLGMAFLTEGLKRAAGKALHRLLANWTRTRLRGLLSGALITALVQSSSAVTVTLIGFANAGLVSLGPAAWVLFGSNVGTTMTGWLVALVGLRVKVEAAALPLLGLGMLLRLLRPHTRLAGIGEALAGLGALFLGLDLLKEAFSEFGEVVQVTDLDSLGALAPLVGVGIGALATTLMQSSSAAMAVVITARSQGLLSPEFAAALVIGANVGTTSTALLSTLGATPNAKRLASLHVIFNLLTAVVAVVLLTPLLQLIGRLHALTGAPATPAADLALFHTLFNVLGLLLMWPLSRGLVRWLDRRFRSAEEDEARPQFLDANVLPVPELAVRALYLELRRASALGLELARDVALQRIVEPDEFSRRARPVRKLLVAIADYAALLNRASLTPQAARAQLSLLRAHGDLWTLLRIAGDLVGLRSDLDEAVPSERPPLAREYVESLLAMFDSADTTRPTFELSSCQLARDAQEAARDLERERLSALPLSGAASLPAANQAINELSLDRRLASRAWKLAAALEAVRFGLENGEAGTEPSRAEGPAPASPPLDGK